MENSTTNKVTIIGIKIPFMSMVLFMVKAAIAAIPAVIILSIIMTVIMAVLSAIFGGSMLMMQ